MPLTPPIVTTALWVNSLPAAATALTAIAWPLVTVPAAEVNVPPLIEYSPPVIAMGVAVSIPATVMVLEVCALPRAALVTGVKVNAVGIASARVVTR